MLFKNKKYVIEGDCGMAFDTVRVGANICKLRKCLGITQTELADRLGISFQAVSNWERGNSMPDISKLGELSEILGASIDDILGNERIARIADAVLKDEPAGEVTREELESIAPMLNDEQMETLVDEEDAQTEDIASVAPFLSTGFIDEYARKRISEGVHPKSLTSIVPFMSQSAVDALADEGVKLHGLPAIMDYVPFLSSSKVDRLAIEAYEKHKTLESIMGIVPFISNQRINELALQVYGETGELSSISPIMPFVSDSVINSIAKRVVEKEGIRGLQPLLPFIETSVLEKFLRKK